MQARRQTLTSFLALLATALLVGGCASPRPSEPKPEVHRIALIPIVSPAQVNTENKTLALPLLPAMVIQSIDNRRKSEAFDRKMEVARKQMGAKLQAALLDALKADGFDPFVLENVKRSATDPDNVDFKSIAAQDPVLQVAFYGVGMYSPRTSLDYEPRVNAWAILKARPDATDVLTEDYVYYGADSGGKTTDWSIPADPKYRYPSFDALIEGADDVAEAYDVAVRAIAQRIAKQLRAQL